MKTIRVWFAIAVCALVASQGRATLIAEWQFNSGPSSALNGYHSEYGPQSTTAGATSTLTTGGSYQRITGTTVNAFAASSPNRAFAMNGSGGTVGTLTLHISGIGLGGFQLTYATEQKAGQTAVQNWYYSTDGTTYTALSGGTVTAGSSWGTATVNFGVASSLNNAANVYFQDRWSFSATDKINFDNIAIGNTSVVPEPITYAMALFGLVFVGGGVGRFYLGRRQQAV